MTDHKWKTCLHTRAGTTIRDRDFLEKAVRLIKTLVDMKRLKRQGWFKSGVPPCSIESLADHSFGTALIALIISLEQKRIYPQLDTHRVVCAALLHDVEEAMFQDLDASAKELCTNEYSAFKNAAEEKARLSLQEIHPSLLSARQELSDEERAIVDAADKMDMIIQASSYWHAGDQKELGRFFDCLDDLIQSKIPSIAAMATHLEKVLPIRSGEKIA